MAVKLSTVKHKQARMGRFATQDIGKDEPVGRYGAIVPCKTEVLWSANVLGEGSEPVTKHEFQSWAIRLGQMAKCADGYTLNV